MARFDPDRALTAVLLALSLAAAAGPAFLAAQVDPPGNDLALHGVMVTGGAEALRDHGWNTFQDPWLPAPNGGYAIFHSYPHIVEKWLAVLSVVTGIDPWRMLGLAAFFAILALPLAAFLGGRMIGLTAPAAAGSALFVATVRSADSYAHGTLSYGFESHGLFGQLCGMGFASLALAAWYAASCPSGAGLRALTPLARGLLAALLVGIVLRINYPVAWVLCLVSAAVVAFGGPLRELPSRGWRFAVIGALGGVLAAGFLVPFVRDLDAVVVVVVEHAWKLRSIGLVAVLQRLALGQYFDGAAHGPWTPALLAAAVWAAARSFRAGGGLARGLLMGLLFALMLLAGRETWGDWVERLPVVGRFHDHRYVIGLMLVGPWLLAEGAEAAWGACRGRARRIGGAVAAAVVVLALLLHGLATWRDCRTWQRETARFETFAADIEPLVQRSLADPDLRLALGTADRDHGGTTAMWWLRRRGVNTGGRTLHQFAAVRQLAIFWEPWITDPSGGRNRSITSCDLQAMGVSRLAVPRGLDRDAVGRPWILGESPVAGGGWTLLEVDREHGVSRDLALVRSDLLVRADRLDLDGFSIAWFLSGHHCAGQYPSLDVGLGAPVDAGRYARTTHVEARDPSVFEGLPQATPASLGRIDSDQPGSRASERVVRTDVTSEGAWLRFGSSWHPNWRASVDGHAVPTTMLTPGHVGIPLEPGSHEVSLWWRVPRWRGWWAGLNVLIYVLGFTWIGRSLWKAHGGSRELKSEI